ncbi:MAG: hypothetical protein C7N36_17090 [Bacteroidetes bacterium]|nr:MAG: hypothetical protein C7N36_17090 [Bacteroidota bacterium]
MSEDKSGFCFLPPGQIQASAGIAVAALLALGLEHFQFPVHQPHATGVRFQRKAPVEQVFVVGTFHHHQGIVGDGAHVARLVDTLVAVIPIGIDLNGLARHFNIPVGVKRHVPVPALVVVHRKNQLHKFQVVFAAVGPLLVLAQEKCLAKTPGQRVRPPIVALAAVPEVAHQIAQRILEDFARFQSDRVIQYATYLWAQYNAVQFVPPLRTNGQGEVGVAPIRAGRRRLFVAGPAAKEQHHQPPTPHPAHHGHVVL